MATPLWSLVSAARNDNYMGDYLWRLSTCLNYLAWNLQKLGRLDDVEVVIVDWDSPTPLHQVMPLTQAAAQITRFIIIPPDVAKSFHFDSTFPSPFITNVGLRRAKGEFIMNIEADTCMVPSAVKALFDILEGKIPLGIPLREAYCVLSRRQVPVQRSFRKPTVEELDQYLSRARVLIPMDQMVPGNSGRGGGVLMHRDLWHQYQGLDQTCIHWGWNDCDLHFRITQNHQWLDLANFGVDVIHLEHYTGKRGRAEGPPRKMNPEKVPNRPVHEDQKNWGMGGFDLPEGRAATIVSDDVLRTPPHVPGTVEPWDLTLDQMTRQLHAQEPIAIRNTVFRYWDAMGHLEHLPKPHIESDEGKLLAVPAFEAEAITWLAWYAAFRRPRTYLDVGNRWGYCLSLVAIACPGVEIYGVDSWQRASMANTPTVWYGPNALLSCINECHNTQSYTRFVTGDARTALPRLFTGNAAPQTIDLAFLRTDPAFGDPVENALQIAQHLAPGGLLVITSAKGSLITQLLAAVRARFPAFQYFHTNFGLTGIILASSLRTNS